MEEKFKKIIAAMKANRKTTYIWIGFIVCLFIVIIFRPGRKQIEESRKAYLKNLKDTTNIEVTVRMPKYQFEIIKQSAEEEKMTEGQYIGIMAERKNNMELIKDNVKVIGESVTKDLKGLVKDSSKTTR